MDRNRIFYLIALLLFLCITGNSAEIETKIATRQVYQGEQFTFYLYIHMSEEQNVDISQVKMAGKSLRYEEGESSRQEFTQIINGQVSRRVSVTKVFTFYIPTLKKGIIQVPAFKIKVGSKFLYSQSFSFEVLALPQSSDLQLETKIVNSLPSYYPTQIIHLRTTLYYRKLQGIQLSHFYIPILSDHNFQMLPSSAKHEIIINDKKFPVTASQSTATLEGKTFQTFAMDFKLKVMTPGDYQFEESQAKVHYKTGRYILQGRDFWGEPIRTAEEKSLYARALPLSIKVKRLPIENKPESFNGAIGDFQLKVFAGSDTAIKVGDPITLIIEISGRGTWDLVKIPPIDKLKNFRDYFKIGSLDEPGEVSKDEDKKIFKIRIRAKTKTAKKIPAIPFTYFDVIKEKYITRHSQAIPITVFEARRTTTIVDFHKKEKKGTTQNSKESSPAKDLERLAKKAPALIAVSDNFSDDLLQERHNIPYYRIYWSLIPFFLAFVALFLRMYLTDREKIKNQRDYKKKNAYKKLVNSLEHLDCREKNYYRRLKEIVDVFIEEKFSIKAIWGPDIVQEICPKGQLPQKEEFLTILEEIEKNLYTIDNQISIDKAKDLAGRVKEVFKNVG